MYTRSLVDPVTATKDDNALSAVFSETGNVKQQDNLLVNKGTSCHQLSLVQSYLLLKNAFSQHIAKRKLLYYTKNGVAALGLEKHGII